MPIFPKTIAARHSSRLRPYQRPVALPVASLVFAAMTPLGVSAARAADQPGAKASGAPAELEEIVVTARYRAESLQNTPIAITALGSGDLEPRGITDVTGLTASAP